MNSVDNENTDIAVQPLDLTLEEISTTRALFDIGSFLTGAGAVWMVYDIFLR